MALFDPGVCRHAHVDLMRVDVYYRLSASFPFEAEALKTHRGSRLCNQDSAGEPVTRFPGDAVESRGGLMNST